jgi:hypothetical protein
VDQVKIPLDGDGTLIFEVDSSDRREEIQRVGRTDRALHHAGVTLQAAIAGVTPAVESIARQLRAIEDPPTKLELTFGIKVSGEADMVIAKTASEAHFQVTVEWSDPRRQES